MNPVKTRLLDLAAGFEGSTADITLSPLDAIALGVTPPPGGKPITIKADDLKAKADALDDDDTEAGQQLTPVQASVSPGPGVNVGPKADAAAKAAAAAKADGKKPK